MIVAATLIYLGLTESGKIRSGQTLKDDEVERRISAGVAFIAVMVLFAGVIVLYVCVKDVTKRTRVALGALFVGAGMQIVLGALFTFRATYCLSSLAMGTIALILLWSHREWST
jgi:uncharacterized BrkB/YihY/UPF0761 family membrane protein